MSCKFYLVRHGQSLGNLTNTFLGHTDLDLSDLGYSQAKSVCQYLSDRQIDVIYSSDLLRAYNTAKPLSRLLNKEINKSYNLREIYAGEWEGKTFDCLTQQYATTYSVWRNNIGEAKIDGGESVQQLYDRITTEIKKIAKMNDGKTVAIFTHATPIRVLRCFCEGFDATMMKDIKWCPNSSVSEMIYDNDEFKMIVYGYDDFLGDMRSQLPSNV